MDVSDDVSTSSNLVEEELEDSKTNLELLCSKKRKHMPSSAAAAAAAGGYQHSLFKAYNSTSSDGKVSLVILKQPEKQHRARYHTEGSRGAVKDRGQTGFPTIQLRGYHTNKTALLQVFVGSDTGTPVPHLYYQACKVSGKNSTPCREMKKENTDVILIDMDPDKDRIVVCDCVGILKERHSDIEGKVPPNKRVNWKKKTTKCRIVFRVELEFDDGRPNEILQAVTDTISCTQLPGTPEILKMSMTSCSVEGGEELWLIGKNFLKDTEVIFKEESSNTRSLWCEKVKPIKEFFSNNHLIVNVPPYKDPNSSESVVINICVKCGSKSSEPKPLTLKAAQPVVKLNGLLQPTSNGLAVVNLTNGSGSNLMVATMQRHGKDESLPGNPSLAARPTILEQIEEHKQVTHNVPHVSRVSKKRRDRKTPFSRTREQPEIDADEAMFDTVDSSSTSLDRGIVNWSALLQRQYTRQASADRIQNPAQQQQVQVDQSKSITNSTVYRQHIIIPEDTTTTVNAEVTNFMTAADEASSNQHTTILTTGGQQPCRNDQNTVTSPTAHFENLSFQTIQQAQVPLSFAGISKTGFKLTDGSPQQTQIQQAPPGSAGGYQAVPPSVLRGATANDQQQPNAGSNESPNEYAVFNTAAAVENNGVTCSSAGSPASVGQQAPPSAASQPEIKHENNCSLGFDNSGSESATISIKLPPSVLQDQKQLSTIVNTISKALQPQTNSNEAESACDQVPQSGANVAQVSNAQQNYSSPAAPEAVESPPSYNTAPQQSWTQSPPDSSGLLPETTGWGAAATGATATTDDGGYENKRKRVLESDPEQTASWNHQPNTSWVAAATSSTTWTETKTNSETVSTSGWSFETPSTSSVVAPPCTFSSVTTSHNDNSSDSSTCTKWENINAKPLGQWPPPVENTEPTAASTALNTFLESHQNWTSSPAASTWKSSSKSSWDQQPMDSNLVTPAVATAGSGNAINAEMMPVNPKEVSPMDVDDILRCASVTSASNSHHFVSTNTVQTLSKLTPIVVSTVAVTQLSNTPSESTVNIINSYTT